MNLEINSEYDLSQDDILEILDLFRSEGVVIDDVRNTIKTVNYKGIILNVKSFKIPNVINRFAYKYIRQSKAKRSFLYAKKLLSFGMNTPSPIAFIEYSNSFGITNSFYLSIQQEVDYTFKELIGSEIANIKSVLIEFTRFTYKMHKKGVFFIDHSPGNTLISKTNNGYDFYLVDLNRTKFYNKEISLDLGIKNFYRLGSTPEMVEVMAKEYALLRGADEEYVLNKMMQQTMAHNLAVAKKKAKRKAR